MERTKRANEAAIPAGGRKATTRGAASTGGTPAAGNRAVASAIQMLAVGPAGDRYEKEADRVAKQLTSTSVSVPRREPAPDELRLSRVRRSVTPEVGEDGGELDSATHAAINRAGRGGTRLEAPMQREMESAFSADFSSVRVHTGPQVDDLNNSMGALAFTTGPNVFVRSGGSAPGSRAGKRLIAHELTHVVQQGAAPTLEEE